MKTESHTTWNKIAQLYEDKFMDMDFYNESYDEFLNLLKSSNNAVFEIGCGPGNISKYLINNHRKIALYGIDIAPNMVDLARKNNPTGKFEVMDCRMIGEIKKEFDGIICGFCIPYLNENETTELITNCASLLQTKGAFYLSFVDGDPVNSSYQTGSSGDRVFFNYHRTEKLINQLLSVGFSYPKIMNVNYPQEKNTFDVHTILLCTKIN